MLLCLNHGRARGIVQSEWLGVPAWAKSASLQPLIMGWDTVLAEPTPGMHGVVVVYAVPEWPSGVMGVLWPFIANNSDSAHDGIYHLS